MIKLSVLQRMTISAMMIALYVIFTRFLNIPVADFIKISLGPAILIFSSLLVGPIYGAVIGAAGDLIGAAIVPYMGGAINPFLTLCYAAMGAVPGLILMMLRKVHHKQKLWSITYHVLLVSIFTLLTIFVSINDSIQIGKDNFIEFNLVAKILIPIIIFILLAGIDVFTYFFNKSFKNKLEQYPNLPSPYQIAFITLIIQVVFMIGLNNLAKMWLIEQPFFVMFFPSLFLAFIYLPLNTLIISYLSLLSVKIIRTR